MGDINCISVLLWALGKSCRFLSPLCWVKQGEEQIKLTGNVCRENLCVTVGVAEQPLPDV